MPGFHSPSYKFSHLLSILSEIPQGSILGPLLFLIYVNDIPDYVSNSLLYLLADDAKYLKAITDLADSIQLQSDIISLCRWGEQWSLLFNPTKIIQISFKSNLQTSYTIGTSSITKVESHNDLYYTIIKSNLGCPLQSNQCKSLQYFEIVKKVLVLNGGHWEEYSEMPTARCQATAVGYHSKLIVIGGTVLAEHESKRKVMPSSTIEVLDTANGSWHICTNLPSPYCQMKAVVADDKLYLLGGFDVDFHPSSQVIAASLDTISNYKINWQFLPNTPWHYSSAAVLHDKFLLAVGGRKSSNKTSQTREVCILNPSTGLWESISKLPGERSLPAVVGIMIK